MKETRRVWVWGCGSVTRGAFSNDSSIKLGKLLGSSFNETSLCKQDVEIGDKSTAYYEIGGLGSEQRYTEAKSTSQA